MISRTSETGSARDPDVPAPALSLQEVGQLLAMHYGLDCGRFEVTLEFQIGVGVMGAGERTLPSAIVGVSKLGLKRIPDGRDIPADLVVDLSAKGASKPAVKKRIRKAPPGS